MEEEATPASRELEPAGGRRHRPADDRAPAVGIDHCGAEGRRAEHRRRRHARGQPGRSHAPRGRRDLEHPRARRLGPADAMDSDVTPAQALRRFLASGRFAADGAVITDLDGTAVLEREGRIYLPPAVEGGLEHIRRLGRPVIANTLRFPRSVIGVFGDEWHRSTGTDLPLVSMKGSLVGRVVRDAEGTMSFEEWHAETMTAAEIREVMVGVEGMSTTACATARLPLSARLAPGRADLDARRRPGRRRGGQVPQRRARLFERRARLRRCAAGRRAVHDLSSSTCGRPSHGLPAHPARASSRAPASTSAPAPRPWRGT